MSLTLTDEQLTALADWAYPAISEGPTTEFISGVLAGLYGMLDHIVPSGPNDDDDSLRAWVEEHRSKDGGS